MNRNLIPPIHIWKTLLWDNTEQMKADVRRVFLKLDSWIKKTSMTITSEKLDELRGLPYMGEPEKHRVFRNYGVFKDHVAGKVAKGEQVTYYTEKHTILGLKKDLQKSLKTKIAITPITSKGKKFDPKKMHWAAVKETIGYKIFIKP